MAQVTVSLFGFEGSTDAEWCKPWNDRQWLVQHYRVNKFCRAHRLSTNGPENWYGLLMLGRLKLSVHIPLQRRSTWYAELKAGQR